MPAARPAESLRATGAEPIIAAAAPANINGAKCSFVMFWE